MTISEQMALLKCFTLMVYMYILKIYSIRYTLRYISFEQNKRYTKIPSFFFHEPQLVTVLLLTRDSYVN